MATSVQSIFSSVAKTISRIPRWIGLSIVALIVLFVGAYVGLGWLVVNRLTAVSPQTISYDQVVASISGDNYTIAGGAYNVDGVIGGIRNDGSMIGIFSLPKQSNVATKTSVRQLAAAPSPALSVGDKISLQGNIWITDPLRALGLPFQDVVYQSPLGPMKAWLIPPLGAQAETSAVWTIGVHGVGADKNEMLRFVKPVVNAGSTMMVINYRNDVGNPKSPDGINHLSDTEWQDLQAAVRYAKDHGATDIRLYGDSLGGSIVEGYLTRSADVSDMPISRVVLDSPALSWKETIQAQLKRGGYPAFLYYPAKTMLALRTSVHIGVIDTVPAEIRHKTLIIHSSDDQTVPQAASKKLAAARPDLVTLVDLGGGGHLRSWNYDQKAYEQVVGDFLRVQ